jgi:hypothetical protein
MTTKKTATGMTLSDAVRRAAATFVFGATSAPLPAIILDKSAWLFVLASGVSAVWNFLYRWAEVELKSKKGY